MDDLVRQQSVDLAKTWLQNHKPVSRPVRPPSLIQRAMNACGVSDGDNCKVFSSIMIKKGRERCEEEVYAFESEIRQGEHKNAKNLAAILTARLKSLPDANKYRIA